MKRTVIALILLIGILCLVACQNTEEPPAVSRGQIDSRLVGFWREKDGEGYLQIDENGAGTYKGKASRYEYTSCYCRTTGDTLIIDVREKGETMIVQYRFMGELLILDNIVYEKK